MKVARHSLYYRVASYLQRNHPSIARVGRFALWSLRAIRRQLFGAGGVFRLAVTGLLVASLLFERHSALLAGIALTGILASFSLLVLGFAEHSFKHYIDQRERLWKERLAEQEKARNAATQDERAKCKPTASTGKWIVSTWINCRKTGSRSSG